MEQLTDILKSFIRAYGLLLVVGSMLSSTIIAAYGMYALIRGFLHEEDE